MYKFRYGYGATLMRAEPRRFSAERVGGVSRRPTVTKGWSKRSVGLLFRLQKSDGFPFALGRIQVPFVACEEHFGSRVVIRDAALVFLDESLEKLPVVRFEPAGGVQRGSFELHRNVVFRADSISEDV